LQILRLVVLTMRLPGLCAGRAWNLLQIAPIAAGERAVSESVLWMIAYFGLAVIAIVAVFFFAMRFVNSTRSKDVQLKWEERRPK
jgi:heme/copper-type cytochrome/quinol oxidase subunit 2